MSTTESNEPVRECPYCGEEKLGRSLTNHIRLSDDDKHGERYTIPADFDIQDAEIVDTQEVGIQRENDYQKEHDRYLCTHCDLPLIGKRGLGVHLRKADDLLHPEIETADDIDYTDYPIFPASDGVIRVPSPRYAHWIEHNNPDNLDVVVDETIEMDDFDIVSHTGEIEALKRLRTTFRKHIERNDDASWLQAYEETGDELEKLTGDRSPN